jgi:hypothetical protein
MQSVNDDMDDLFRRAAEDYPLRTKGADWSKVMQGLEAGAREHIPQQTQKYKSFLWIAAVFLLVICTTYIRRAEPLIQTDMHTVDAGTESRYNDVTGKLPGDKPITNTGTKPALTIENKEISLVHNRKPNVALTGLARKQSPFLMPPIEKQRQEQPKDEQPRPGVQVPDPANTPDDHVPGDDQIAGKDSANLIAHERIKEEAEQPVAPAKEKKKKVQLAYSPKLYAGLVAGPDLSTIRSQKVSNAGYTVGLIAGYRFSNRLSFETGILWDRKDYYTTGKHFNKGALGLPQHAKIIDVDGYCNMFEIPVNLKFNWVQKKNYNLFATTGISSYLMKREEYDYVYDYYGTQYKYYKQYDNASRNWMSILNISLGYEKKIGNAGSLRIEPYMKLPLKGVGIGEMPIGSKGILVGFTHPIR